jgi:2-polyprenyl-3-methyl-5-hydroxy-6-metoxy-1,4-benzoquinol methylase
MFFEQRESVNLNVNVFRPYRETKLLHQNDRMKKVNDSINIFQLNRESIILPLCEGKSVFDIGCATQCSGPLYDKICKVANEYIGVDIKHDAVKKLQKRGYNIIYGNAETVNLGKKFDVIVA